MAEEALVTDNAPTTDNWKDSVSREVRFSKEGNDKLERFESPASMASSYLELEKMNSSRVSIPTEESAADEVSAFYTKLGRPDTPEGYTLPELKEGEYDKEFLGSIAGVAFENGVSDKQFGQMVERYLDLQNKSQESVIAEANAQAEKTQELLKSEWKDEYDKNIEISRRALRELVPEDMTEDLVKLMEDNNLDNNPVFIKAFKFIGDKMLDDSFVKGDPAVNADKDYVPAYKDSPAMYENGDDEDSKRARAYFRARDISFTRKD